MPQTRRLLREEITYSVAKDREVNVLHQLKYPEQQSQSFGFPEDHSDWIRSIVAYHLNLPVNACQVADSGDWLHGGCNVCIPVVVAGLTPQCHPGNRLLVRFPLPYRVGELSKPGNSDEKVRCEAGTYAWLEESCPDIPIPRLYGFGMGSGKTRTLLTLLHRPIRSRYDRRQYRPRLGDPDIPYLLIEYIEESQGRMLSSTWNSHYQNDWTYSTVDSFVADTLSFHDSRLQSQPNAVNEMPDFLYQASCLATMRTVSPLFSQRHLRRRPFLFSLTDLHPSNIFVDENWHITSLVDLEFACSVPIEMIHPPHWLTTMAVDRIQPEEYDQQRLEFMALLAEEERCHSFGKDELRLSNVMGTAWSMGTFWYSLALATPSGVFSIFRNHIRPCFIRRPADNDPEEDDRSLEFMPWYWARNLAAIYGRKVADKRVYDGQPQHEFDVCR
ncbi:hypothetical protein BJY04DRAFT_209593 [Aspergillus karnatakaensis]|uniref:uncharacterized protein n=1 Tax=Aspergillus karnatakaensis TaxID=1810916 RepID=UPI003CCCAE48